MIGVNAVKTEKIRRMHSRLNPKSVYNGSLAAKFLTQAGKG